MSRPAGYLISRHPECTYSQQSAKWGAQEILIQSHPARSIIALVGCTRRRLPPSELPLQSGTKQSRLNILERGISGHCKLLDR